MHEKYFTMSRDSRLAHIGNLMSKKLLGFTHSDYFSAVDVRRIAYGTPVKHASASEANGRNTCWAQISCNLARIGENVMTSFPFFDQINSSLRGFMI